MTGTRPRNTPLYKKYCEVSGLTITNPDKFHKRIRKEFRIEQERPQLSALERPRVFVGIGLNVEEMPEERKGASMGDVIGGEPWTSHSVDIMCPMSPTTSLLSLLLGIMEGKGGREYRLIKVRKCLDTLDTKGNNQDAPPHVHPQGRVWTQNGQTPPPSILQEVESAGHEWEQMNGTSINNTNLTGFCLWYCEQKDKSKQPSEIKDIAVKAFKITPEPDKTKVLSLLCKEGSHDLCGGETCSCECHEK